MNTNLKEALKSADTVKSPLGDVACYSMNFAELAGEINVHLEGNKVKFTWREYIQLAQIIWEVNSLKSPFQHILSMSP